jgi:hypothetical protein
VNETPLPLTVLQTFQHRVDELLIGAAMVLDDRGKEALRHYVQKRASVVLSEQRETAGDK